MFKYSCQNITDMYEYLGTNNFLKYKYADYFQLYAFGKKDTLDNRFVEVKHFWSLEGINYYVVIFHE